ncbi:MAG: septum formation initiator [Alphaproteobacteria bacterium]|jgi:cell division protein FtsB|nr:septum formation initiator [Alphaproteobacteria bacterium]
MTSRLAAFGLAALMLYFAFHAFAGETGLGHWSDMQARLAEKRAELDKLEADIAALERDIERLRPESVDPDYIERLAREKLAFVYPGELILVTEDE